MKLLILLILQTGIITKMVQLQTTKYYFIETKSQIWMFIRYWKQSIKKNTHIKKPRCLFYFYKMYQHYDYEHFRDIDITEQEQETLLKHCQKTLRHWLEDSMMMV